MAQPHRTTSTRQPRMFPFMVETEPGSGVWRLPEPDDARLPLLYSLKATKG
jgi:hypothetical protein